MDQEKPQEILDNSGHNPAGISSNGRVISYNVPKGDRPGGIKVRFGRNEASVLRNADDEIDVQAPPGNPGESVDVTVTFENAGDMALRGAYTYTK